MDQVNGALGVLSGEKELRVGIELRAIAYISAGVFIAMLLALILAHQLNK